MPNTTGDKQTFNASVQQLTASTPAYGPTLDAINQQLVNNDSVLFANALAVRQAATPSGVIGLSAITTGMTPNQYSIANDTALIAGMIQAMINNIVTLDAPPTTNVTPSLPGSARDDLVFYEFWRSATGAPSSRIRVVDGLDFATYPEGINQTALVKAQGGAAIPTTYAYTQSGTDKGVYVAGDGSGASVTELGAIDGLIYAIPLQRVRRRNSIAFDPDSNPLGAKIYYSDVLVVSFTSGSNVATIYTDNTLPNEVNVGDTFISGAVSGEAIITAIGGRTAGSAITFNLIAGTTAIATAIFTPFSDRPDGLYPNIIDANDIIDLRHQVSLTGFNNQALFEKSLDLLLRGQLNTKENVRYGRDYIGLNLAQSMPDDVNTLLLCKFDGSMVGTANGSTVTNTKLGTGTETYKNGVQGAGAYFATYSEQFTTIGLNASTGTLEILFKPDAVPGGNGYQQYFSINDDNGTIMDFYQQPSTLTHIFVARGAESGYPVISVKAGEWNYSKITWDGTYYKVYVNEVYIFGVPYTPGAITGSVVITIGGRSDGSNFFQGVFDSVRLSNIVRSGTPLPTNFSYANGDRILDGPNGDFALWSDDVGGTTGVGGRTNPYGLSRVPNQIAARVSYDGSEVRHYFGNGATPVWSALGASATPVGAMDAYGEYMFVPSIEVADGSRTTFTFTKPSNAQGMYLLNEYTSLVVVNSVWQAISSATIDNTGKLTVTLSSAPANGAFVQLKMDYVQRHVHFIPSTKGFVLHDWTDDTFSASGTIYQTTKFDVISINHVRTTPSGQQVATIQGGGYTTAGLNASTTLSADAASGATTLTVASGANFVAGQNIRISKGDGTWYTTTVTSVSSNNLTVSATTADLKQNATVQGTAQVTFAVAPDAGTVDIVYESVITPGLGDYIRVMYQSTPYQGTGNINPLQVIAVNKGIRINTLGTGKVFSQTGEFTAPISPNLPMGMSSAVNDYMLKGDALATGLFATGRGIDYWLENIPYTATGQPGNLYFPLREGASVAIYWSTNAQRGFSLLPGWGGYISQIGPSLLSAVPHQAIFAFLAVDNTTSEVYLVVNTTCRTDAVTQVNADGSPGVAIDTFKLQGRPMIKNYGGMTL